VHLITQHPLLENVDSSIEVTQYPFRGNIGYFTMVASVRRLLGVIKPDVLNAHYASGYATTARLVGFHPWVLSVWGSDVYDVPYESPLHKYLVKGNLLAADKVASTSHCMASQIRKIAPELKQIAITPFGVEMQLFQNASSSLRDRPANSNITIGTVKVLTPNYEVHTLIKAFHLVYTTLLKSKSQTAARLRLRIVGDGLQREELMQLALKLKISHITTFTGRVAYKNVPAELEKLDIYIALSLRESFGVAIIEAGAASRPVIVSDADGLKEVVVDKKTGLIVPKSDVKAVCVAIMKLVEDEVLRIDMGKKGREHVVANYDWHDSVNIMSNELDALVKKYRSH